jgi:glucose dehydrogenase
MLVGMTDADVCIVGSGFAGTLLAQSLVRAGVRTVMLEAGRSPAAAAEVFPFTAHHDTVPGYQPMVSFKLVGGHSALWGGTTVRFSRGLVEGNGQMGAVDRWPIRYEELEQYYDRAEPLLLGDAPGLPADDTPEIRRSSYLTRFSEILDARYQFVPFKTRSSSLRLAESVIPALQKSPLFRLLTGATAVSVEMVSRGRARGVRYRASDGSSGLITARSVVVAGGAIQTPRLLLLSRSVFYPRGIGNDDGLVGRYFTDHFQVIPSLLCVSDRRLSLERDRFDWGRHWRHRAQRAPFFVLGTGVGENVTARDLILRERAWGRNLDVLLRERVGTHIEIRLLGGLSSDVENRIELDGGRADESGLPVARIRLKPNAADEAVLKSADAWIRDVFGRFGLKSLQYGAGEYGGFGRLVGGHLSGSCRMGESARASVVDPTLRVHGVANLFISGAATFVTGAVENPTLTISALALRLGDHMLQALRRGDF